jgi:hypothetical protein
LEDGEGIRGGKERQVVSWWGGEGGVVMTALGVVLLFVRSKQQNESSGYL